jgi:ABC-type multidrug transport system fused ATPase/permease subunit
VDLDWKSIAGTVAPLAPTFGKVLGTGFGPVGSIIGGLAGEAIAAAFGTEPTPEAVGKAIAEDPNAGQKLQDLEAQRGQEILAQAQVKIEELKQSTEQTRIFAEDTDKARQFNVQLAEVGSPLSWGASVLATVFTIAFFVLFAVILTTPLKENSIIMAFVGTLTAGMIQILSFFFGSSAGSKNNADRFASLASQVAAQPNPSPQVVDAIKTAAKKK